MKGVKSYESLLDELEELKIQLQEANDTIEAIRSGQVDALFVQDGKGHQLFTLKSADQTYRVFIEKMKEGAVTLNSKGVILYSNSQFASMVNLPLRKVIGLNFTDFITEDSRRVYDILIEDGWNSDSKGEVYLRDKNEKLVPFLLTLTSLELDEGEALSIILTDLTAQKETERQLKQKNRQLEEAKQAITKINAHLEELVAERTKELFLSREHFKFLADNIPVIVWTTNPDGILDYVNRRWFEYTGLDVEVSKIKRFDLIHQDDLEKSSTAWKESIKNKTPYEQEFRFRRNADGSFRWHYAKAIPFLDEKGNVAAWIGTSIDIDDQKAELDKKDEFISVASHELKTPLTSLKGYLQIMKSQDHLPDDTKLYIARGNTSVNKLQHLINELLDASRIKAGKLEFDKHVTDLNILINNCAEAGRYMYPQYDIRVESEDNIWVWGNDERLEQVIMNLINNAVKYSPDNKGIIVKAEKNGSVAVVSVIDKGVGIANADKEKIFERFFRTEDTKFHTSGLGMGLYISSEIIKEHNSTIVVKSKLDEGSVFSFSLPLADNTPDTGSNNSLIKEQ